MLVAHVRGNLGGEHQRRDAQGGHAGEGRKCVGKDVKRERHHVRGVRSSLTTGECRTLNHPGIATHS